MRTVVAMKKVTILRSACSKSRVAHSKTWFAICMLLLIVSIVVVVPSVLAQLDLDVDTDYEITFEVTSTTTLWDPGTHSFEMSGVGELSAPFVSTFTVNGSGTATYSIVGGGSPPGEFDVTMELSGYLEDSFFNGPYTMTVVAHGETVLAAATTGYIRTEEIVNLSANGTFNESPWNATSTSTTVDFSDIGSEGKSFEFRVTGSSHVIPEFPSAIVMPLTLIAATLVAVIITRIYSKKTHSK